MVERGHIMQRTISELGRLWHEVLEDLGQQINDKHVFDAFLSDSFIHSINNNLVIVAVNSDLAEKIVKTNYMDLINASLKLHSQDNMKAEIMSKENLKQQEVVEEKPLFFANSVINPTLTFDNFIVGECNRQAKQAALYIAANPGKAFNPLFIYSQSGLGKTHLLHAIANHIKTNSPGMRVLYCSADDFFTEYLKVVRGEKEQVAMKDYIAKHDVLLIDDIQFFSGKRETENFFFQIFQRMHNAKKQIVITSDKHPSELNGFEQRLTSRFSSGLVMNIDPPDTQTCVAILKSKINAGPLDINNFNEAVLNFIAEKFSKSVRNLDEALNRIIFYTTSFKPTKSITMDVAMEAVQNLIDVREAKTKLNENRIITTVAEYYNLTPSQLTGKSRLSEVTTPRHIAMYLIREVLDVPFAKIGYIFGGKDHSTVMNGVKKVENELKKSVPLQTAVNDIKNILNQ